MGERTGAMPEPLCVASCVSAAAVYDSRMKASTIRRTSKSDSVRERMSVLASGGSMRDLIGDVLEKSWRAKIPAGPPRFRTPKKQKLAELIRAKKLHRG